MTALLDHREGSDTYHGELFRREGFRVIVCKDGIQWIVQRITRDRSPRGGDWRPIGYCLTRAGVARVWAASGAPNASAIDALPDHFTRGEVG